MFARRAESAWLQSDFYREQFYRMLRWLVALLVIMFILIILIIYTLFSQPASHYYANTLEGQILPMPTAIVLSS